MFVPPGHSLRFALVPDDCQLRSRSSDTPSSTAANARAMQIVRRQETRSATEKKPAKFRKHTEDFSL